MMNERIRELAIASELVYPDGDSSLFTSWRECDDISAYVEKFAESIVQECMAQIQEVRQLKSGQTNPTYQQGVDDGMFVAIRTIEEHFGVEE